VRVLISGINYRPEVSSVGPYTAGLAEHLADRGDDVTVVTGLPHYPQWRLAPRTHRALWSSEQLNGVEIRRAAHYVPRTQSAIRRAVHEATFGLTGFLAMLRVTRPDVIVGITPSLSGAVVARLAAERFGVPYGILFQDLMGLAARQSGVPGGAGVASVTAAAETWAVRRAIAVAVVSQAFVPYLEGIGVESSLIHHVPNWSRLAEPIDTVAETRERFGWDDERTVVLHAGNIGFKQGLEQVIDAARLAEARAMPVRFVLAGGGNRNEAIREAAAGLTNIEFIGVQPDGMHASLLAAADVLLLSERPSQIEMSLPSKLTSYFAAGRPIIGAVSAGGASAAEIERSGAGLFVPAGQPEALLASIGWLRDDADLAARLGAAGPVYADANTSSATCLERAAHFVDGIAGRHLNEIEIAA
jgi:glycosyltransferase involved in cell wall biosynthesis